MSVLTENIRKRLAELNLTAAEASKEAFGNDGTIRNILIGASKNPRSDTMIKLAEVLKTTPESLLSKSPTDMRAIMDVVNDSEATPSKKPIPLRENSSRPIPVYASAEGGNGALIITSDPVDWAGHPNVITDEEDLYGVVIEGTSMVKAYRPGDTVWIHPKYRERRDEPCIFRGFNDVTGEAKATIKWLLDFNSERWLVEQLNPQLEIELSRQEWPECYRVLGKKNRA